MPSVIGAIKIVSNTGDFINGDTVFVSPTHSTKSYNGSGTGLVGDLPVTINLFSVTLTNDPDVNDANTTKVATA